MGNLEDTILNVGTTTAPRAPVEPADIHECLSYFGLTSDPFRSGADPRLLWLGRRQQEVLTTLTAAIRDGSGIFVITSDIGTGKTSLTYSLVDNLKGADVLVGRVTNPGADISDFFQAVANACRIKGPVRSRDAFASQLRQVLDGDGPPARKVLVIIDEAQSLSNELLREIRDLSMIGTTEGHALAILLVGQTELKQTLSAEIHAALRERIALTCTVDPLTPHEVGEYIGHCLKMAGATAEIFSADAIREIALLSRGTPVLINTICDRALLAGYARRTRMIDREVIDASSADLRTPERNASRAPQNGGSPSGPARRAADGRTGSLDALWSDVGRRTHHRTPVRVRPALIGLGVAAILIAAGYLWQSGWSLRGKGPATVATPPLPAGRSAEAPTSSGPAPAPASVPPTTPVSPSADASATATRGPAAGVAPPDTVSPAPRSDTDQSTPTLGPRSQNRDQPAPKLAPPRPETGLSAPNLRPRQNAEPPAPALSARSQSTEPRRVSAGEKAIRPDTSTPQPTRRQGGERPAALPRGQSERDTDSTDPAGIIDWLLKERPAAHR